MKAPKIDPQLLLYGAAGLALLYVTYKVVKGTSSAIDAVTGLPGQIGDAAVNAWHGVTDTVANVWNSATDIFDSGVAAGTTTTPRTVTPAGASFNDIASGTLDPFDPRYYGVQGNVILPAQTSTAGAGGGTQAMGSTANSAQFFAANQPFTGM